MQLPAMADSRHAGEHPTPTPPDHYPPIFGDQTYPTPPISYFFPHGPDLIRP